MKHQHFTKVFSLAFLLIFVFGAGLAWPHQAAQADPLVSEGSLPAAQGLGGVRFKGLSTATISGDKEIYLGNAGVAPGYRTETDVRWANGANQVTFTYDAASDTLTAGVSNTNGTYTSLYANFSTQLAQEKYGGDTAQAQNKLGLANYLEWSVVFRRSPNATVSLRNLALDGTALGDYEGVFDSWLTWHLTGVDLGAGFTLTGDIVLANFNPASVNEHNKIEFSFGWLDEYGPETANVQVDPNPAWLTDGLTLTAEVNDAATGGTNIAAAEYALDGGEWTAMSASDGGFDSASETVTAALPTPEDAGTYAVCVRGTDAAGATGEAVCTTLTVNDNLAPTTGALQLDPASPNLGEPYTLALSASDLLTGNSTITAGEYHLTGGSWQPLTAFDGSFDSAEELLVASALAPTEAGIYQVCARVTDQVGNTSLQTCTDLEVLDNLAPETNLLSAEATESGYQISAMADDTATGSSMIAGAEVALDGGSWQSLAAEDGAFDAPYEVLSQAYTATLEPGSYPVCVRSSDSAGNTSPESCGTLVIPDPEIPDTAGPVVARMALVPSIPTPGAPFLFSAQVDDLSTGGSDISQIEYTVNDDTWLPMNPEDGAFSGPVETGVVEITLEQVGSYALCVRGTDAAGNTGEPDCVLFTLSQPHFNLYIPVVNRNNP